MRSIKWLLAGAALATVAAVSGCAYDDTYYNNNPYAYNDFQYDRYAYGPDYYVAPPVVTFGATYERHYWDGRRWHHWDGHRWVG